jgi:hypothetical protein
MPSTVKFAFVPGTEDVKPNDWLVSRTFEVTVNVPVVPVVPDSRDKLEVPSLLVTIDAVTPRLAELIALISPRERVGAGAGAGVNGVGRNIARRLGSDDDVLRRAVAHLDGDGA